MNEQIAETPPTEESLVKKVFDLRERLTGAGNKNRFEAYSKIVDMAEALEAKYPNSNRVYLFHAMIASGGVKREICPDFDFPGEDSVVTIMENLCKEYEV